MEPPPDLHEGRSRKNGEVITNFLFLPSGRLDVTLLYKSRKKVKEKQ